MAVCIISYNTCDLLRACLHSVLEEHPEEIIVVDNASRDNSTEMVESEFASVTLIRLNENLGYGAAANRAIRDCHSDYVLLLNSDTVLKCGALGTLRNYLEMHQFASLVGPRILNSDGTLQTSCFHFPTPIHILLYLSGMYKHIRHVPILSRRTLQAVSGNSPCVVPWVLGAALAIRREAFEAVDGFDESFFMYFEEVDLCYRLSKGGRQVYFVPVTEIIHIGGASTGQQQGAMDLQYFASLAQFYRKHYSRARLIMLIIMVKAFALIRLVWAAILLCVPHDAKELPNLRTMIGVSQALLANRWSMQASHRELLVA